MAMPKLERDWTVADLADLPEDGNRYEVLDGTLYVTPTPSFDHQTALQLLSRLIAEYLEREPVGFVFIAPADVTFSQRRGVQPDLFVMPPHGADARRPRRFEDGRRLLLAVEVLSPTTGRADRVAKRAVYREEGVETYWVVDLEARTFERSVPTDSRVEVLADRVEWRPAGAARPLIIDVADYFRRVLDA
jgi:Uma2 family endonuclease